MVEQPARQRIQRRPVHGVLLLDKPLGLSSNAALQRARYLLRAEKAGHTGTLDPLATGLLPLCFGAATKFSQASLEADKTYRATLRLGQRTSTGDLEGDLVEERSVDVERADIERVLVRCTGMIDQLPPMHSALKKDGRALYDYARAGQTVERAPRRVCVHRIDVVEWHSPRLVLDVCCSKGTYIRTLAEDIGEALGCGAHLAALRRSASGALTLVAAVTLDALAALDEAGRDARLLPVDALLAGWPRIVLDAADAGRFLAGMRRRVVHADAAGLRVYGPALPPSLGEPDSDPHAAPHIEALPGAFLGSAHVSAGELIADRLLSPLEVQAHCQPDPARAVPARAFA